MDVDNANSLSTFAKCVSEDDAARLIFDAAFALGKSEAELARLIGVSRATLSSWKARGAIPASRRTWFEEEFPIAVLGNIAPSPYDDFRHAGMESALKLLDETDFNPFGLRSVSRTDLIQIAATHFGGLVRLSQFVDHRAFVFPLLSGADPLASTVWVMKDVASYAAHRLFPTSQVSQRVSQSR